jgi:hypothetical protein
MTSLFLSSLFLSLSHFLISSTRLRALLVCRLGVYSFGYSFLAVVGLFGSSSPTTKRRLSGGVPRRRPKTDSRSQILELPSS